MPWDLYVKMEPGITVYSDSDIIEPAYAPVEALLAIPEMTEEDAVNFVEERHSQDAAGAASMALPSGITSRARGRGLTYSVIAKATLPNGIWDQIETTIRLGAGRDRRPYRIVQWREGFHH
jgi:general secretion pathway protein K